MSKYKERQLFQASTVTEIANLRKKIKEAFIAGYDIGGVDVEDDSARAYREWVSEKDN